MLVGLCLLLAFSLPCRNPWTLHVQRPDDASLSCYQHTNGTWACMSDLCVVIDPEDSY